MPTSQPSRDIAGQIAVWLRTTSHFLNLAEPEMNWFDAFVHPLSKWICASINEIFIFLSLSITSLPNSCQSSASSRVRIISSRWQH